MNELEQARLEISEADKQIAFWFEKRMTAAVKIADYKAKSGRPVEDPERERVVFEENCARIKDPELREYYRRTLEILITVSKEFQTRRIETTKDKESKETR